MNKLPLIEVLLLAFVSFDKPVSGKVTTGTIRCPPSASANTEVILKCLLSDLPKTGANWRRPDRRIIVTCGTIGRGCTVRRPYIDKYTGRYSGQENYRLIIHKFNPKTDVGEWCCSDGPNGSHNSCDLKLTKSSLDNLKNTIEKSVGVHLFLGVLIFMLLILALVVVYLIYRRRSNNKGDQQQMASLTESGRESANTSTNNTSTNNTSMNNSKNMAITKEQSASLLVSDFYTAPH